MFIKLFLIALPVFFVIDMVWLVLVAKKFYQEQIGFLMKPDINWFAAIIFYLLFIAGLVIFVISPAVEKHSWVHALIIWGIIWSDNLCYLRFNKSGHFERLAFISHGC